jgi:two-component sensor histidine kinase/ActR/RegA family two-component response regulator
LLRFQRSDRDHMSFLAGDSEMARRIRDRDWSVHPFGEPEGWPTSLRVALSICLQSKFPTSIYWGPELRLLYNDAWAPIPGPRHPAALGMPAQVVWSDIWHVLEPQFRRVVENGEGVFVQDQMLPMQRFGYPEETYWSYSLTAIRDEEGSIVGVFNSGYETTRNVLSQRQMRFLLELGDAIRGTADARTARNRALEMFGQTLGADRVGLHEMSGGGSRGDRPVTDEWLAEGVRSIGRSIAVSELGDDVSTLLRAGRMLVVNDVSSDMTSDTARAIFAGSDVGALIAVPKIRDGQLAAVLFVHSRKPRVWTLFDISTAEQVLERIWNWMDSERTAERERLMIREIDHRAKNALAVVQAVIRLTLAEDISSFREKIEGRVAALTRTHDLLSAKRWEPIEFGILVHREIEAYRPESSDLIDIQGSRVLLRSEQAQTIALLLHELTTNAAKYGALSVAGGRLSVHWRMQDGSLVLEWDETLVATDRGSDVIMTAGFGSKLINSVIERQLGGSISRDFDRGLKCRITIPLASEWSDASRGEAAAELEQSEAGAGPVLIVEDEALVALDLANMLRILGYDRVETVASVSEALATLKRGVTPELAIVDINLAGESSEPVVEVLRRLGTQTILASGYAQVDALSGVFGGLTCLPKPIILSDFTAAVQQVRRDGKLASGQ